MLWTQTDRNGKWGQANLEPDNSKRDAYDKPSSTKDSTARPRPVLVYRFTVKGLVGAGTRHFLGDQSRNKRHSCHSDFLTAKPLSLS